MPPGRRRKSTPKALADSEARRLTDHEPITKPHTRGQLRRGVLGQLVRDTGKGALTVWILGWRCKQCRYTWPVRQRKRTTGKEAGTYLQPRPLGTVPSELPKKCPGCDSSTWWRDPHQPLHKPRGTVRKYKRQPSQLAQWREEQLAREQAEGAAPAPKTLAEILGRSLGGSRGGPA